MFDPMLGEWPIDTLSSPEDGTQKMSVGGKPSRPKPAAHPFSLVRKPPPKDMPSGMKPYGLRTRDNQVPKLKGRPSDGLEYEPLLDEGPSHSGAGDDLIGNKLVEDAASSARPADDELKTARSDKQRERIRKLRAFRMTDVRHPSRRTAKHRRTHWAGPDVYRRTISGPG